ncbi:MAG: isoprenyl transferase [bacterium]
MPDYSPSLLQRIDSLRQNGSIPEHVAIIMDGNARWARRRDKAIPEGHREGVRSTKAVADLCGEIEEIKVLTLYAFSTENWSRPEYEIQALMQLLKEWLRREVDRMVEQNVRFETIGDESEFSESVREELDRTKRKTADNDEYILNLALNYGSRDEITRAVRRMLEKCESGDLSPEDVTEETIGQHLDTAHLPDPDFLIRTSGEKRLSNYLLWQLAYAEIFFPETLWPDFREDEFLDALREFQDRDRRFGDRKQVAD